MHEDDGNEWILWDSQPSDSGKKLKLQGMDPMALLEESLDSEYVLSCFDTE